MPVQKKQFCSNPQSCLPILSIGQLLSGILWLLECFAPLGQPSVQELRIFVGEISSMNNKKNERYVWIMDEPT